MKKLFILLLVLITIAVSVPADAAAGTSASTATVGPSTSAAAVGPTTSAAGGRITEVPDVRFIIDNVPIELSDVPISLGGRTLLPLRAVLSSLGVRDDNDHIIWDDSEKSVTVLKDGTKIYLKIGSKTAYINDVPESLDVAPLCYEKNQKSRTYIPVRFISTALGKAVAWDANVRTVYVRNQEKYATIKTLLDNINSSMTRVRKVMIDTNMKLDIYKAGSGQPTTMDVDVTEEIDKDSNRLHQVTKIPLFGSMLSFEAFFTNKTQYVRELSGTEWTSKSITKEAFDEIMNEDTSLASFNSIEVMASCMEEAEAGNPDQFILRGAVYPKALSANIVESANVKSIKADKYFIEALIDKDTDLIKRLTVTLEGKYTQKTSSASSKAKESLIKAQATINFSDYDGDLKVEIPEGLSV